MHGGALLLSGRGAGEKMMKVIDISQADTLCEGIGCHLHPNKPITGRIGMGTFVIMR
jgi:hypothetical protein